MSEVTLINPPSPFLLEQTVMPPLGILYIASSLKKAGVKVNFVDFAADPNAKIPISNLYGITATTPQLPYAVEILRQIYQGDVIIGGPAATVSPKTCLDLGFDAVAVGEGEKTVIDFLSGARGIIKSAYLKNLDKIPFPDRSLVKGYKYTIDGALATTIMTSRGCPYNCAFCCHVWEGVRFRSAENVVDELKEIRNIYGYRAVMIYDDEWFLNKERDFKIASSLHQLGFVWRCFSRANLIDEHTANVASLTGCKETLIGIESGSEAILKAIHKGCTVEQNKKAITLLHEYKIRVKAAMIIMLPSETKETLRETWEFCEEMESYVSSWDFTICTPYPKSPIYDNLGKYDFYFEKDAMYSAYKGAGSEAWKPPQVWTSHLSFEEGVQARYNFERRFKFRNQKVKLN